MSDKDKIKTQKELWKEATNEWGAWMIEAEEDMKFRLGDQWDDADKAELKKQKRPILSLNHIKKQRDIITGYEKQNRTDVRVQPVEGADQVLADVYSEIIKWSLSDRGAEHQVSKAFEDAVDVGIGWVHPYFVYDRDVVYGDIRLKAESPFRIMPDPDFTEMDLSDCEYIFRHALMNKDKAKSLYPDFAEDIEKSKAGKDKFEWQQPLTNTKSRVNIIERWYREYEEKHFMIADGQAIPIDKTRANKIEALSKASPEQYGDIQVVKRKVPVIKLLTTLDNDIILYDDYNPHGIGLYPFIPIFGQYTASYNELKYRIQGVVRGLKDVQREKNKRRSQLLHAAMTVPLSGWMFEEGAIDDPETLKGSAGAGKGIKVRNLSKIQQINPQQIPQGLVTLEQLHDNDMVSMGLNADLLGATEGGSAPSAPGISLQLRQRQGLIAVQGIFDNLSFSKKMLGKYLIEMINENFDAVKIQRITNKEVPPELEESKSTSNYDCVIDEVVNSPTYRMNNFVILANLQQQGFPVSPMTLIKWSDFPQGMKDDLTADVQQAMAPPPPEGGPPPGMPPEMMGGVPQDMGPMPMPEMPMQGGENV